MHGGTIADAVAHVQSELEFQRDQLFDGSDEQELTGAIAYWAQFDQAEAELWAARNSTYSASLTVAGWSFWIQPCYTVDCTEVETEKSTGGNCGSESDRG